MKNIIKFYLITLLISVNVYAMKEENIISDIQNKIDIITSTVKENKSDEVKRDMIFSNLKEVIDFEQFYQLSLGKDNIKKFTNDELELFKISFEENLKNFYFDKFKSYNNQKFSFDKELKQGEGNNKKVVKSFILDDKTGQNLSIDYKVYFNKNKNEWLIYDVEVEEISILKTYRAQFNEMINLGTPKDLIAKLNSKNLEANK